MAVTNFANLDFSLSLFDAMQKDNLSYIYRGIFNQQITDSILTLTETNLQTEEQSSKMKKRVYAIMVEGLQNVTRHQEGEVENSNFGLFVIKRSDDKYYITTGNQTEKTSIPVITKLIKKINSLDKEELKVYYKQVLNEGELSSKGGAGLGLIDMAKKSGNKLNYRFLDINKKNTYFYLHTIPSLTTNEDEFKKISNDSLDNIIDIHKTLNNEDIRLIYNGIFNQESLMGLLHTIEGHMSNIPDLKNKMFYIVLEMLQNIVKHGNNPTNIGGGNPGIFFISQKGGQYLLNTGNYIEIDKVEKLKTKLEYVNSLSDSELQDYYASNLMDFKINDEKKTGLGIIDLRLKSSNKISFYFKEINSNYQFFALQIKL
jgi:ribosomal 30S subunit maturation factor RimM